MDLASRFWTKVAKAGPNVCWEWTASRDLDGYGQIGVGGRSGRPHKAHRISWLLHHGTLPSEMVCHSCDNPGCVNPSHLWLGDDRANQADASRKGRQRRQAETHCVNGHKWTPENTYWRPGKIANRDCRQCVRDRTARHQARRREA